MFEKVEVYPYQRKDKKQKNWQRKDGNLWSNLLAGLRNLLKPDILLWSGGGVLLGRAVLFGALMPFIPAYAASCAVYFKGWSGIFAALSICLGLCTVCQGTQLLGEVLTVYGIYFFIRAMPDRYMNQWLWPTVAVFALTLSIKGSLISFGEGEVLSYINLVFEGIFAAALTPVLLMAHKSFIGMKACKPLASEEVVYILIVLGGIVAGTGDLQIGMFHIKAVLSNVLIMICALAGGAGIGAAAGALAGIVPGMAFTAMPLLVGSYAFGGVIAGLGKNMGKIGVCVGFLLANIILCIYVNDFAKITIMIGEIFIAFILFFLIPHKWVQAMKTTLSPGLTPVFTEEIESKTNHVYQEKIHDLCILIKEIAGAFQHVSPVVQAGAADRDMEALLREIKNKVCFGCGLYRVCWEKDYYRTYQQTLEMLASVETFGRVTPEDMPGDMRRRCTRPREMSITVSCLYDAYELNQFWSKKLSESRNLLGEQLAGVVEVMERVAEKTAVQSGMGGDMDAFLKQRIKDSGFYPYMVKGLQYDGHGEVVISGKACEGVYDCRYKAAPVVSTVLDKDYYASGCLCQGMKAGETCTFRLYEGLQYDVQTAVAVASKNEQEISGDSYCFAQLGGGKFVAIVSDGMGSGEMAAFQSSTTIAIIKHLLEFGFDVSLALKTVNSILMLRLPEETFCTVDVTMIDLYHGQGEIMKIASPPSYLIRGKKVTPITGNSLPVGIVNDIHISSAVKQLEPNDIIVMVTDGVQESCMDQKNTEDWLLKALHGAAQLSPEELAQLLLSMAKNGSRKKKDDMTVVVIKMIDYH